MRFGEDESSGDKSNMMYNNDYQRNQQQQRLFSSSQPSFDLEFESEIEKAILNAQDQPLDIDENEYIKVRGQTGIWLNKREVNDWEEKRRRHSIQVPSIGDYELNEDPNPQIIQKKTTKKINYVQDFTLRLLRPPTPESPGDILIRQEADFRAPPAPPLIIRQHPLAMRPQTPLPLIIRERPPEVPPVLGKKVITIPGKQLPPPPRKVIIERLPQHPPKPQPVLVERWLPYPRQKRKVIFESAPLARPDHNEKTRNMIIEWQTPNVICRKEFKNLGVHKANPLEYAHMYRDQLLNESQLPQFVHEIKNPEEIQLANEKNYRNRRHGVVYDLEGDIDALKLVDLDKEGLSEYRSFINSMQTTSLSPNKSKEEREEQEEEALFRSYFSNQEIENRQSKVESNLFSSQHIEFQNDEKNLHEEHLDELIYQIFRSIDSQNSGRINIEDARQTLLQLNNRLIKKFKDSELNSVISCLYKEGSSEQTVTFGIFRKAFMLFSAEFF